MAFSFLYIRNARHTVKMWKEIIMRICSRHNIGSRAPGTFYLLVDVHFAINKPYLRCLFIYFSVFFFLSPSHSLARSLIVEHDTKSSLASQSSQYTSVSIIRTYSWLAAADLAVLHTHSQKRIQSVSEANERCGVHVDNETTKVMCTHGTHSVSVHTQNEMNANTPTKEKSKIIKSKKKMNKKKKKLGEAK